VKQGVYLGIDGCRGGWCVAVIRQNELSVSLLTELAEIPALIACEACGFIDMPIGLTDSSSGRLCEVEARAVMPGTYKSSIFFCPSQSAVSASDYSAANAVQRSVTGKGLSVQAWNIVPKIRQVQEQNSFVKEQGIALREAHPELCFAQLSGSFIPNKKRTATGRKERVHVLGQYINLSPMHEFLSNTKRNVIAVDDALDCVCLAISARFSAEHAMGRFPEKDQINEFGVAMEIVYPLCSCLFC